MVKSLKGIEADVEKELEGGLVLPISAPTLPMISVDSGGGAP
jgi:hypothetical protein